MVGSDRTKQAVGMMALHEALRNVCVNSDWTYSVFWTIRPRPSVCSSFSFCFRRSRGGAGGVNKTGDENGTLMLMWEDGFCRARVAECLEEVDGHDPVRKAFSKMSIQLYNYGEGLMGKVASDKCHKWVFKEPSECEPNISNYWQSSFDALPPEWTDQFASGIETIAVIQAGHGLLQLGSCKIIPEDLHFVLRMRHTFESLGYQSGFYLSQLFSSSKNTLSVSTPSKQRSANHPPPIFNWNQGPLPAAANLSSASRVELPTKDGTHLFLHRHQLDSHDTIGDLDTDIKWPNGLSFFNALTARADDSKLLFGPEIFGDMGEMAAASSTQKRNNRPPNQFPSLKNSSSLVSICSDFDDSKSGMSEASNPRNHGNANDNASVGDEYLSLESHSNRTGKMGSNKFMKSFTMPAGMEQEPQHHNNSMEAGIYSDIMDTLE